MLGWTEPSDSSKIDRMAATTSLMTIEEFCKLPEDDGPVYHELRHGEVVPVTRPKLKHQMIQSRLRRLLEPLAPPGALVEAEVAFRALPQYELRAADVAYLAPERWAKVDPDRRQIKVSTPDGCTISWQSGQEIPLPLFSGAGVAVDAIFA